MGDFPNIFKRIREQSGLTQQQMADKLGISRSAIGMYEKGEREPNFETLELIADTYYLDKEAREAAQFLYENPDYKVLFDASRKVKKEDIDFVKQMIDRMTSRGDD